MVADPEKEWQYLWQSPTWSSLTRILLHFSHIFRQVLHVAWFLNLMLRTPLFSLAASKSDIFAIKKPYNDCYKNLVPKWNPLCGGLLSRPRSQAGDLQQCWQVSKQS